ncbi:MAG: META domain-containing protein [Planctomycetota bacterium]
MRATLPIGLMLWLAAFVVPGCTQAPPPIGQWRQQVVGPTWTLTRLDGRPPLAGHAPTLTFAPDGRVAGDTGANRYFATYDQTPEGGLRFAALGSTRMFRGEPAGLMDQEQRYFAALGGVASYRLKNDRLILRGGGSVKLVFECDKPDASTTSP